MYIVCRKCNDSYMIAKTMGEGYYQRNYSDKFECINDFYNYHAFCTDCKCGNYICDYDDTDICSENQFTIGYEHLSDNIQAVER